MKILVFAILLRLFLLIHGYFPIHQHLRIAQAKRDFSDEKDSVRIDCGTILHKNDILEAKFSIHANSHHQTCYVSFPTHVFIAISANFYSPLSNVRLIAGNHGKYNVHFPKIFASNSSLPYRIHREDLAHVFYVPCSKAAIQLNAYHPNDHVIFQFHEAKDKENYDEDYDEENCYFNTNQKRENRMLISARVG